MRSGRSIYVASAGTRDVLATQDASHTLFQGEERVDILRDVQDFASETLERLKSQKKYGVLELNDGKMSKIKKGDIIAGVLGERKALEGIVGGIPQSLKTNDTIHILNLGGVLGIAQSWNPDFIDNPLPVKVLGAVAKNNSTLNIKSFSLKPEEVLHKSVPIVLVLGTSMGVGKTTVVKNIIALLAGKNNLKVAAGKLTGVATQRDLLVMKNAGAIAALSFLDVGLTSTISQNGMVVPAANAIINSLNKKQPDVIVAELGDGVIGWYGVNKLLENKEFMKSTIFIVGCANDLMGAAGLYETLKKNGLEIDFFSGPVTNNSAGTDYLEQFLKIPSQDLRHGHIKLVKKLSEKGVDVHD